ncbi:MAG: PEGA domain-containing protein [Byssovorax sp.]
MSVLRSTPSRWSWALASLLAATMLAGPSRADEPPDVGDDPSTPAAHLALAKDLFRKGVALLQADDVERALSFFLRSRAEQASAKNTGNAAICLSRLGRYDEALEMYEELLLRFSADLDAEDRATLIPAMAALRDKVGAIRVSASVDGLVVIDGRARGQLPFSAPVRVLGGAHTLRIFKDGYVAYEARVDVAIGTTLSVDARLAPLAGAGLLRVADPGSEGFEVFVDGSTVGYVPWEGTLGLGRHLVWIQKKDRGSSPSSVAIVEGQTALAQLPVADLGPPLHIAISPPTAGILLDGVALGLGSWSGRLPVGGHRVVVSEEGYRSRAIALVVQNKSLAEEQVKVDLAIDPESSRWPRPSLGRPFFSVFGGYLGGMTLHSSAEQGCPTRCFTVPSVLGGLAGVRVGFRFKGGLAPEIAVGVATVGVDLQRSEQSTFASRQAASTVHVSYRLDDRLRLNGGFFSTGGSAWFPLRPDVGLLARVSVGVLFAHVSDPITGEASVATEKAPIVLSNRDEILKQPLGFVLPELGAEARLGSLRVGFTVGAAFFPGVGPRFSHENTGVNPRCESLHPTAVGCAPITHLLEGERAFTSFVLWSPQIAMGYVF